MFEPHCHFVKFQFNCFEKEKKRKEKKRKQKNIKELKEKRRKRKKKSLTCMYVHNLTHTHTLPPTLSI